MIDTSKIYTSNNCGDFKIISYTNYYNVEIEFMLTGYKVTARSGDIVRGNVKDRMHKSVHGVGFIGDGKYRSTAGGRHTESYNAWHNMISRCYCPERQKIQPTYKGCTVDKAWHNFQVFSEWFSLNYIKGFDIDKDIKIKRNKVYSPETCLFVERSSNIEESHAKHYVFISPQGDKVKIYNMRKFCRENNLKSGSMSLVYSGKRRQHKGWMRYNKEVLSDII